MIKIRIKIGTCYPIAFWSTDLIQISPFVPKMCLGAQEDPRPCVICSYHVPLVSLQPRTALQSVSFTTLAFLKIMRCSFYRASFRLALSDFFFLCICAECPSNEAVLLSLPCMVRNRILVTLLLWNDFDVWWRWLLDERCHHQPSSHRLSHCRWQYV